MDDSKTVSHIVYDATAAERKRCLEFIREEISSLQRTAYQPHTELAIYCLMDIHLRMSRDAFEHGILEAGKILNGEKT